MFFFFTFLKKKVFLSPTRSEICCFVVFFAYLSFSWLLLEIWTPSGSSKDVDKWENKTKLLGPVEVSWQRVFLYILEEKVSSTPFDPNAGSAWSIGLKMISLTWENYKVTRK